MPAERLFDPALRAGVLGPFFDDRHRGLRGYAGSLGLGLFYRSSGGYTGVVQSPISLTKRQEYGEVTGR